MGLALDVDGRREEIIPTHLQLYLFKQCFTSSSLTGFWGFGVHENPAESRTQE